MTGALATVDVQNLAGDEGSVFQKHDRVDDVLNFSHTSDWMQLRKEFMCFGSVHWRLHDTGSNGVNPNSPFCVFDRQGFCGCVQAAFGYRGKDRRNVAVGVIDEAGRDLHDVTRPLLQHFGRDAFGDPEEASKIGRKDRSEVLFCILNQWLCGEDSLRC